VFRYDRHRDVEVTVKKWRLLSRGFVLSQSNFHLVITIIIQNP